MQPDNQQGYYQPGQGQPAIPNALPPPASVNRFMPSIDPAALQAALDEPTPTSNLAQATAPSPNPVPLQEGPELSAEQPVADMPENDEDDDGEYESIGEPVSWTANEYIHREKGTTWFTLFAVVVVVLLAVSIFLMQSVSFAILLAVIAVVVVVYSRRPPRELTYSLDDEGLTIDGKLHEFEAFKSFGVIRDGEEFSVMMIPIQRFQPGITVYFPEEAGEDIVDIMGSRLPMKDLHLDVVDRIVRLLRL